MAGLRNQLLWQSHSLFAKNDDSNSSCITRPHRKDHPHSTNNINNINNNNNNSNCLNNIISSRASSPLNRQPLKLRLCHGPTQQ
mmetsp:Transcript_35560/g.75832  ORF Transcript_35560/g.75832 Transcript_35560/m.75832 type:complete len:84 (-) Transcript_35560:475-726(-)